jgi:hypothetical protein
VWSLILREEHRLRKSEIKVLKGLVGGTKDEEMGGWRKLHEEELHNFYSSSYIV